MTLYIVLICLLVCFGVSLCTTIYYRKQAQDLQASFDDIAVDCYRAETNEARLLEDIAEARRLAMQQGTEISTLLAERDALHVELDEARTDLLKVGLNAIVISTETQQLIDQRLEDLTPCDVLPLFELPGLGQE